MIFKKLEHLLLTALLGKNYNDLGAVTYLRDKQKQSILKYLLFCVGILLAGSAIDNIINGVIFLGSVKFSLAFACLVLFLLAFFVKKQVKLFYPAMVVLMLACGWGVYLEVSELWDDSSYAALLKVGTLVSFFLPIVLTYFLGLRNGLIASLGFGLWHIFCRYDYLLSSGPEQWYNLRITGGYFGLLTLTVLHEITKNYSSSTIDSLMDNLQFDNNLMNIIRSNIKTGLFLLNKDFAILPGYSKSVEMIFQTDKRLNNVNFVDLLADSLKAKETASLKDFLEMVLLKTHDAEILNDINPLNQFLYVNKDVNEEKTLRCIFAGVTGVDDQPLILASVDDISAEVALRNERAAEDDKRQSQINDILAIIHLDPRVLQDFIDDTNYEFNRINEMLKASKENDQETTKFVIENMYLSIHAIKSDAVVLGLRHFSEQLHGFEDKIKELREEDKQFNFLDLLNMTFDLNRLMQMNDDLGQILKKILSFASNLNRLEVAATFSKIMEQAAYKVAKAKGRSIKFISDIEEAAILNGPRRVMKEMLMQLTKNAVYHGIEDPESRKLAQKDPVGVLSLTMKADYEKRIIRIQFSDDGWGLNLKAVRAKVRELNLMDEAQLKDDSALINLLFSPAFSTASRADLYAGRGAGLALVKTLVQELHGSLSVYHQEGKGTRFTILIPFQESPTMDKVAIN